MTHSSSSTDKVKKVIEEGRKEFNCPDCSAIYLHESSLSRHRKSKCGTVKLFVCDCEEEFDRLNTLKRHKMICKGKEKKPTKCQKCLKQCQSNWYLIRHMKSCEKKCEKCKKSVIGDKSEHQCAPKLKVQIYTGSKKTNMK